VSAVPLSSEFPLWPLQYIASLDPTRIRVLLALEDPALRGRLAAALGDGDHEILEAGDGIERLEHVAAASPSRWQADPPDVLVSALRTAGSGDLEALSSLRRAGFLSPILLIVPAGRDDLCLQAYWRGADIVLSEPLDPEELRISVRALAPHRG
jgi:DNA-binding response OmpR family regulator